MTQTAGTGPDLGRVLSILRILAGGAVWAAPQAAVKVLGDRVPARTSLPLVLRLFGARDLTMGLGYLQAAPHERDRLLKIGMGVDAADAAAALVAHRRGQLPASLAIPFAVTAAVAVLTAAVARRQ